MMVTHHNLIRPMGATLAMTCWQQLFTHLVHTRHTHTLDALQGRDGHLKPIPSEDDFATPRRGERGGRTSPADPDLALAMRLQQEEMARMQPPPTQPPPPHFARNPVGPQPPPSLPQRARSVRPNDDQDFQNVNIHRHADLAVVSSLDSVESWVSVFVEV